MTALACVLSLGGCYQGFHGTVNAQPPSGNGKYLSLNGIAVQNTLVVTDPADSGKAALSFTMVNASGGADALVGVALETPANAKLAGPIALPDKSAVAVGGTSPSQITVTRLQAPPGSYTKLTLQFAQAGEVSASVLVVRGTGVYAAYAPR